MGAGGTNDKRVLIVFGLTALAWIMRGEPFDGWSIWFGLPDANDAMVAFLGVNAVFLIPNGQVECLLDRGTASDIPWGVRLLFGAGIAIAGAFSTSRMAQEGLALNFIGVAAISLVCYLMLA